MSTKGIKDDLKLVAGCLTNAYKRNHNTVNTWRKIRLFEFIATFRESYNVLKHYVGSSTGSSVSTVTKLQAGRTALQIPAGARGESLLQNIQTYCGSRPGVPEVRPSKHQASTPRHYVNPKDLNLDRPNIKQCTECRPKQDERRRCGAITSNLTRRGTNKRYKRRSSSRSYAAWSNSVPSFRSKVPLAHHVTDTFLPPNTSAYTKPDYVTLRMETVSSSETPTQTFLCVVKKRQSHEQLQWEPEACIKIPENTVLYQCHWVRNDSATVSKPT